MDPFAGLARHDGAGYGRSIAAADKPSFDGLPPSALSAVPHAFVADLVETEWERVESLFESGWYGPCSCLGGAWSSASSPDPFMSVHSVTERAAAPSRPADMAIGEPSSPSARCSSFLSFLAPRPRPDQPQPLHQPLLNGHGHSHVNGYGKGGGPPPVYGLGAAPTPETPFTLAPAPASPLKAALASPLRVVPVPRRATETDGNALPVALDIDPAIAAGLAPPAPVPAQLSPLAGPGTGGTAPVYLAPQLGTWADRQYRLLDPVPERGECGPGSGSGASVPSVASDPRSPVMRGGGGGGAAGSGGAGAPGSGGDVSGSGECTGGGSGSVGCASSIAAQVPGYASPSIETTRRLSVFQTQQQHVLQHHQPCNQTQRPGHAAAAAAGAAAGAGAAEAADVRRGGGAADDEAMLAEAAWRWRFTRRWQAEQACTGAERSASAGADHLEEALAYLQTTGATTTTTVSMQIANTSGGGRRGGRSSRRGAGAGAGGAGSLIAAGGGMSLSLDGSLLAAGTLGCGSSTLGASEWPLGISGSGSGSFTRPRLLDRQASGDMLAASREVAALNRQAKVVLQQQMDCERQAEQRVQESLAQGPPWVGQQLPVVQIDEWGSFRFVMLKLRDQNSRLAAGGGGGGTGLAGGGSERQRILIRGHNYGSEGQLVEEANREILAMSRRHGVPFEAPTMMGGGVMEWRRDRDRHLQLHSGFVVDRALPSPQAGLAGLGGGGGGTRPGSAVDLLNLAAALARQSFPPTYRITVLS